MSVDTTHTGPILNNEIQFSFFGLKYSFMRNLSQCDGTTSLGFRIYKKWQILKHFSRVKVENKPLISEEYYAKIYMSNSQSLDIDIRVCQFAKSIFIHFYSDFSHYLYPKDFTK